MSTKIGRFGLSIGALAAVLAFSAPALADHGGGGGHASGGGAHMSSGGHVSAGHVPGGRAAGGYASGGHGYSVGGAGHSYGYAGAGRAVGGGPHIAPSGHYGNGAGFGGGYGGGFAHGGGNWGGGFHGGGFGGWHGGFWGGGFWRGGFWPRAYYGLGFSWFLPVLPLAYATYWWDGSPYYYANNVYYTWNPGYDGYVVTDPPPVNDGASAPADANGNEAPPNSQPPPVASDQIFMYPRNGQSDAQLATDRNECQQWASSQAGGGRPDDYRRAMTACAEARGYSAK
jgi:hypothetical protein